jgi:hypothetical protein
MRPILTILAIIAVQTAFCQKTEEKSTKKDSAVYYIDDTPLTIRNCRGPVSYFIDGIRIPNFVPNKQEPLLDPFSRRTIYSFDDLRNMASTITIFGNALPNGLKPRIVID